MRHRKKRRGGCRVCSYDLTGNTSGVLDGDIDDFIEAEIRWLRTHSAEGPDGSGGAADKAGVSGA